MVPVLLANFVWLLVVVVVGCCCCGCGWDVLRSLSFKVEISPSRGADKAKVVVRNLSAAHLRMDMMESAADAEKPLLNRRQ